MSGTSVVAGSGEELDRVERYFQAIPNFGHRAGIAIRRALDEVIDGPRTGRWDLDQLEQPEKTYIGTKVEILLRAEFELPRGSRLDCRIDGIEVDIKFTIGKNWTIPVEAVTFLCLVTKASDQSSTFSIGLLRASDKHLNAGRNRDQKRSVSKGGRDSIHWLVRDGSLPENVLLHLDASVRERIFSHTTSGQQRVDELFRLVQNRIIPRQTLESVAQQKDPLKRGRDARTRLRKEDIVVICGTYNDQRKEAQKLGLPEPGVDEWISTSAPKDWLFRIR